jgi:peptide/nickel transport system ATP-binding protein
MRPTVLSVKNLQISLRKDKGIRPLTENISFDILKGQTVAMVGESGSGKSITARALMQLLDPRIFHQKGSIIFQKKNGSTCDLLQTESKALRHYRGYESAIIFQEPMTSLNPVMTIGNQLTEAILAHQENDIKTAKESALYWLDKVIIPDVKSAAKKYPHQLSGGQKQRVMIAMAMCNQPALLIADEPTTALDPCTQKEILQLLGNLQKETGMGLLFITHDLGIVQEIAHRVFVMHKGKIVESGLTQKIFEAPQHDYTKALISCLPIRYIKGERIPVINTLVELNHSDDARLILSEGWSHKQSDPNNTKPPVVQVENLCISYPAEKKLFKKRAADFEAVKNVSLSVFPGETVGLIGESGCGKTSLARALLGLIQPKSGNIFINGEKYNSAFIKNSRHSRQVQIVFQDPYASLNPRLQIGKAIEESLMVHQRFKSSKEAVDYVKDLLKTVQLNPDHYHRYPHQFSGGQRQRIGIARALALQPDFIIWDESVSALDVRIQAQILNLLNDLKKSYRFSSLFISHDLTVVKYLCDRMYVMKEGIIVEEGIPEQIWINPTHQYTRKLLDAIPGRSFFRNQ